MHPVDTIKTRMVTKAAKPSVDTEGDLPALALAPPKPGVTQMLLDSEERVEKASTILLDFPPSSTSVEASAVEACAVEAHAEASTHMQTVNEGGLVSLYQGLPGALLKEGPPSALYLGVYEVRDAFAMSPRAPARSRPHVTTPGRQVSIARQSVL